jgi:4-hydroxy-L-threonine phosphate dehydrogenase PdxA
MFMVADELRVGLVTNHNAIKDVASKITKEKIIKKLQLMNTSLTQDFGIDKPRIAVLGLNPHAGDGGVIGNEEGNVIWALPYLGLTLQTDSLLHATIENSMAYWPCTTTRV